MAVTRLADLAPPGGGDVQSLAEGPIPPGGSAVHDAVQDPGGLVQCERVRYARAFRENGVAGERVKRGGPGGLILAVRPGLRIVGEDEGAAAGACNRPGAERHGPATETSDGMRERFAVELLVIKHAQNLTVTARDIPTGSLGGYAITEKGADKTPPPPAAHIDGRYSVGPERKGTCVPGNAGA